MLTCGTLTALLHLAIEDQPSANVSLQELQNVSILRSFGGAVVNWTDELFSSWQSKAWVDSNLHFSLHFCSLHLGLQLPV